MAFTRRYTHHGIQPWELAQEFYGGFNDMEGNMVDISSEDIFVDTWAKENMQFMERLVETWTYQLSFF